MAKDLRKFIDKLKNSGVDISLASDVKPTLGFVPSGSLLLDKAMGTRGYPIPKIVEIYGEPSTGKTLLALMAMASVTRAGYLVIYCDLENNFSHQVLNFWRQSFGVIMDNVIDIGGTQPAEDVINAVILAIEEFGDQVKLVVVDSIGAMTSEKLLEKKAGEGYISDNPKYVGEFCRKLISKNKFATVLMLNHVMANIGSMSGKLISKGGYGLRHLASLRLYVRGRSIVDAKSDLGFANRHELDITVEKSKVSAPKGKALGLVFDFKAGGFDEYEDLITLSNNLGLVTLKPGGWWEFANGHKVKGREAVKQVLKENPEVTDWLFAGITGMERKEYYHV